MIFQWFSIMYLLKILTDYLFLIVKHTLPTNVADFQARLFERINLFLHQGSGNKS